MKKVTIILLSAIITFLFASSFRLQTEKKRVNWMTPAQLKEAYSKAPRPILVDVYTNWCGWCKVMDRETYAKEAVASYINEHFYAVKLDAESTDSLEWNGKKYGFNAAYKSNDLAIYLLYGQMSFPTTVFLADINAQPAPLAGFLKPKELESPLKFFGDGAYKTATYPEFMKTFAGKW